MRKKLSLRMVTAGVVCGTLLAGLMLVPVALADHHAKPKHTIKEVMKIANKDKLAKKVIDGEASDEEKKQLLDAFISLLESEPPKGDAASWQKLAGAVALPSAKVVVGREGAEAELKAANSCKACHDAHKPK